MWPTTTSCEHRVPQPTDITHNINAMNNIHHTPILTRQQCSALRGIAIIGIVLHNYCHWLGLAVKENEYTFTFANCRRLLEVTFSPDINYPVHLLSFFGHYGVPIFLFLSAYGLVLKYEAADKPVAPSPSAWRFVRYHFLKLFKMMIVGYVAFTMVDAITPKPFHYTVADILSQLGMFNNLRPDPDHVIWPGPYWFFGLMLQTYIVYRLLLYRRGWLPAVLLVAACWAVQAVCDPEGDALNRLRYNFIGGIMPFVAGLFVARYGRELSRQMWLSVLVVATVAVVVTSFSYQLWFWTPLFVCAAAVALVKNLPTAVLTTLDWVGGISAAMFVMHPITRKIFIPISRAGDVYAGLLFYIISTIALAWLCRDLLRKIPSPHLDKPAQ